MLKHNAYNMLTVIHHSYKLNIVRSCILADFVYLQRELRCRDKYQLRK